MLSVICPVYNEEKYIAQCIESILEQDYPKDCLEVIFADGMSTDRTRSIIAEYSTRYPWIFLIDNPERIVPPALNAAIKVSHGDIIMRIDAHAVYPSNYFSKLVLALSKLKADNVGGVCVTLPMNDTPIAKAIAFVLRSRFGMGNSSFRVGVKETKQVDTVPFGCWPRSVFEKVGYFDLDLVRNQDDEFNGRIIKNGGKIYLIPEVEIKYYARDKIGKIWMMFYQYGLFKPLVNKKLGSPASLRQFFPLFFVLGLIFGALIGVIYPSLFYLYFSVVFFYLILSVLFSLKVTHNPIIMFWMVISYIIVHIGYGWGYLCGIFKIFARRDFIVKSNR